MVLVGSTALSAYVDIGRVCNDYDLWVLDWDQLPESITKHKLVKNTERSRIYLTGSGVVDITKIVDPTDIEIYNRTVSSETEHSLWTPVGSFPIPFVEDMMTITLVSAQCYDRAKYKSDYQKIQLKYPTLLVFESPLTLARLAETKARLDSSKGNKEEFFHKYDLPEHIEHDLLHVWVAEFMGLDRPTYEYFIEDDTTPSKQFFDNLDHSRKVSRFVEESLVLSWERWLVPQLVEHGLMFKPIYRNYFNLNNVNCPPRQLLNHVCIRGLRDEKPFMREFGTAYFTDIEKLYLEVLNDMKVKGLPKPLLDKVRQIRRGEYVRN